MDLSCDLGNLGSRAVSAFLIDGDARVVLSNLPADFVHCIVTSPPYYGLRSYKIEPVLWPDGWVGNLGMEPDVDQYVLHLVAVFAEVRRVLRPDGVCFVNIGDTYAANRGYQVVDSKWRDVGNNMPMQAPPGLKPLDLCLVPERFVLAMQRAGWFVRDRIAWCKPSPMPESVAGWRWERCRVRTKSAFLDWRERATETDRPVGESAILHQGGGNLGFTRSTEWQDCLGCPKCQDNGGYILRKGSWRTTRAWEHIFMFTKTASYVCFQEQVREPASPESYQRYEYAFSGNRPGIDRKEMGSLEGQKSLSGRNPRSFQFFKPEPTNWGFCLACGTWFGKGGWQRKAVKRWTTKEVNEAGEAETKHHAKCANCGAVDEFTAHYALFPPSLPNWCIRAGTSDKGVCPHCGLPFVPVIEQSRYSDRPRSRPLGYRELSDRQIGQQQQQNVNVSVEVISYRPTCKCPQAPPVAATVLDPFSGAGTTCVAAERLSRNSIGIDCSPAYNRMARARLEADRRNGTGSPGTVGPSQILDRQANVVV